MEDNVFIKVAGVQVIDFLPYQAAPICFFGNGLISRILDMGPIIKNLPDIGCQEIFLDLEADCFCINLSLVFTRPDRRAEQFMQRFFFII